jgi:hypothetical protein
VIWHQENHSYIPTPVPFQQEEMSITDDKNCFPFLVELKKKLFTEGTFSVNHKQKTFWICPRCFLATVPEQGGDFSAPEVRAVERSTFTLHPVT